MFKPGTFVPISTPRNIVSPKRHAICMAFAGRVKEAAKAICKGVPAETIINEHGRIVYREACFNWRDYWEPVTFDSEGRAIFGRPKMSLEQIAEKFVDQKRSSVEI